MAHRSVPTERHQCEAQTATGATCVRFARHFEGGRWVCGTHSTDASTRRAAKKHPERKKPSGAHWRARQKNLPLAPLQKALKHIVTCQLCGGTGTTQASGQSTDCECRTRAGELLEQYRREQIALRRQVAQEYWNRERRIEAKLLPGKPALRTTNYDRVRDWEERAIHEGTDATYWLGGWEEDIERELTPAERNKDDEEWEAYDQAYEKWRASFDDQQYKEALALLNEHGYRRDERRDNVLRRRVRALQQKYELND